MYIHDATEEAFKRGQESREPKWIPVTERMPEPMEDVLCFTVAGTLRVMQYDHIFDDWDISGSPNRCLGKGFVTHWMPLPELPKK